MAPAEKLSARGWKVDAFILSGFSRYAERVSGVSKVWPVGFKERRNRDGVLDPAKHTYLSTGVDYEEYINLYCPGWRHEFASKGRPTWDRTECFFASAGFDVSEAQAPVIEIREEDTAGAARLLKRHGVERRDGLVVLQPFSTAVWRDWPGDSWRILGRELAGMGLCPVVVGTKRFEDAQMPQLRNLDPDDLIGLVAMADLLVVPDSGLSHLAAAVGTPALGLFGPTGGDLIAKHYEHAAVIQGQVGAGSACCPPCYMSSHRGFSADCRERSCPAMASISPDQVMEKAASLLASREVRCVRSEKIATK